MPRLREHKPLTPAELRAIMDRYLLRHDIVDIATDHGRTTSAIEHILKGKLPSDYTEDGERTSLIDKIATVPSILSQDREFTSRDQMYLVRLRRYKLPPARIAILLNVPVDRISEIETNSRAKAPESDWDDE